MTEPVPSDYELAYTILAAAADPVKAKARLDELVARETTIRELTDTLNEARAEHETARAAALSASAAAKAQQDMTDSRDADSRQKAAEITRREGACTDRETALATNTAKADAEHASAAAALQVQQDAVDTAERDLIERQSALSAQEADYQARINKLKAMVN